MNPYELEMSSIVEKLSRHVFDNDVKSFGYTITYAKPGHFPATVKGVFQSKQGLRIEFEILFILRDPRVCESEYEYNLPLKLEVVMAQLGGTVTCRYVDGQWT